MRIGGSEVSSVTHVIVFSENGADDAHHLSDALVQKFGKSPLSVPKPCGFEVQTFIVMLQNVSFWFSFSSLVQGTNRSWSA